MGGGFSAVSGVRGLQDWRGGLFMRADNESRLSGRCVGLEDGMWGAVTVIRQRLRRRGGSYRAVYSGSSESGAPRYWPPAVDL